MERTHESAALTADATGIASGLTLLTMRRNQASMLAVKTNRGVLCAPLAAEQLKISCPQTMDELLQQRRGPQLNALVDKCLSQPDTVKEAWFDESSIEFGPLVSHPEKIICVGVNYREHAAEMGRPLPQKPVLFNKFNTALNCHNGTIKLPLPHAHNFDYEVELVVVIGKEGKAIPQDDALDYVAGYATGNDFTARDLQRDTGGQWMIGKTPDGFAPIGPYMVTADQIDPDRLSVECRVNGEVRQSSNTSNFIFDTRFLISYISQFITLKPGDLIFTGTPPGVIQGLPPEKQIWLKPGDVVTCSVERLGELRFTLA
jgi:2-keto-4-pentenoate hydratase/2-oxohepta-3-ene-1,7-dioic acid hydratase in catechol pathway